MTNFLNLLILAFLIVANHSHQVQAQELRVAIMSVGETNPKNLVVANNAISALYNSQVEILGAINVEAGMQASYENNHGKLKPEVLNAVSILRMLTKLNKQDKSYDFYIGLTDEPLIVKEKVVQLKNQVIRGLGSAPQKAAIISTYKIKLETINNQDFQNVLSKVVNHEMGHILGLGHCEGNEKCLMVNATNFQNSVPDFCSSCLDKIDKKYLRLD